MSVGTELVSGLLCELSVELEFPKRISTNYSREHIIVVTENVSNVKTSRVICWANGNAG